MDYAQQLVTQIGNAQFEQREHALSELAKQKELYSELGPLLWNSIGIVTALLQEVVSLYPLLSPPNVTSAQSTRVCNALALLQCVASHPATRMFFLEAHITIYILPYLNTGSKAKPFEYLRLTSLGVIGALVKADDRGITSFLLSVEIVPLCLRSMDIGSDLSRTVATFVLQRLLLDDLGFDYVCYSRDRFHAVCRSLSNLLQPSAQPSARLFKQIIRCFLRLTQDPRGSVALRSFLPDYVRDGTYNNYLHEDHMTRAWLHQLLLAVDQSPIIPGVSGFW